jgi:nucleotide-binding universal stress UspA family protein
VVHLSVLVFVPLLIGLVTLLSNTVPVLSFLLFPPLASGSYTLFVDPRGKYSEPGRFVAGLTIGAACGEAALWVSNTVMIAPSGEFRVAAGGAVLATLSAGGITWLLDIEEPSAYSTALLALLITPDQAGTFVGSIFLASSLVAVVFVVWRSRFYDRRATILYESTTSDDRVLVPMRGEYPHATAMLGGRLAAAHDAGKVVLLDIADDTEQAETERQLLEETTDVSQLDDAYDGLRDTVDTLETRAAAVETELSVPCQVVVATGTDPAETTRRTAESTNCDLVVASYESSEGVLSSYLRSLLAGNIDTVVHRSYDGRTEWREILVPVRQASDVAHHMIDFSTRLTGLLGRTAVATCIGAHGDRRRADSMLSDLVEPFSGAIETRVSRADIQTFLTESGPQHDLVVIGASQHRSAASRFIAPPMFEQIDDIDTDVAIVSRGT